MRERAREVADEIAGSCRRLNAVATTEEVNNAEFCAELDSLVFECDGCGWWCWAEEESNAEPGNCDECAPEPEDE